MITISIKNYEEHTEHEFRCLIVYQDHNEIAKYQETELNTGDWGINDGQPDNCELLQILGWEDDDSETHEIARAREKDFIKSISLIANR